jgi:hypothetical protein
MQGLIAATPRLVKREIEDYLKQKLDTTFDEFYDATDVFWDGEVLIVEIDDDNWLANALETGVDGWDMKETHLQSPKAKFSKDGYKYMVIPIEKHPNSRGGGTEKSQMYHKLINEALKDPVFAPAVASMSQDGTIATMERLVTDSSALKGFYKIKRYKDSKSFGKGMPSNTQFIMFRTMSNKPGNEDKWIHPGLRGIGMFDHIDQWASTQYQIVAENFLQTYVDQQFD